MNNHGVYVGSFDPPTLGHLDVIERASLLCAHLTVGVGINPSKTPMFPAVMRVEMLQEAIKTKRLKNVSVSSFEGLAVDFVRNQRADRLIRGLRPVADFDMEYQQAVLNRQISNLETQFLICSPEYQVVSSGAVKELHRLGVDVSKMVPPNVFEALKLVK